MVILWSARAERDLNTIIDYLAPLSPQAARRMMERIEESVQLLQLFPYLAHRSQSTGLRELVVSRTPYRVIYDVDVDAEVVRIVTIVHAKQSHRS